MVDAVRADLEVVFRRDYPQVVAVAARVLGSRDEAEDVAQEVFLTFGRSSVPADEAPRWLSVAAAHTALNHLRSGRRRCLAKFGQTNVSWYFPIANSMSYYGPKYGVTTW